MQMQTETPMRSSATTSAISVLAAALLLSACADESEQPRAETGQPVCLEGRPFVSEGDVPVNQTEQTGNAHEIGTLRWEMHEGCGRFVIDVVSEDGRPAAGVGEVRAEVLRDLGVVRIELPQIEWVDPDATDARFEGLARGAYVVRSPDGPWVYVDLHTAQPAEAHVAVLKDSGRVVVDLRPGGPDLPPPPAIGTRTVVLEPRSGEQTYPLRVYGYARTFEANVVARLEQDGEEVDETFTTATSWTDAWGHYEMTFDEGPSGGVELHVGEYSARDGTWEGVAIELDMH